MMNIENNMNSYKHLCGTNARQIYFYVIVYELIAFCPARINGGFPE
jgi:hypothetical protein